MALLGASPAYASSLAAVTITAPVTAVIAPIPGPNPLTSQVQLLDEPESVVIQCVFVYGSGGTNTQAWVQTSIDGGATWIDIARCFETTASLKTIFNITSLTPSV